MNRMYRKGRDKEYRICNRLKREGWEVVQRTAGSHSPFDIIAIDSVNKVIKLVQSKPESMKDSVKDKLLEKNLHFCGYYTVDFDVE